MFQCSIEFWNMKDNVNIIVFQVIILNGSCLPLNMKLHPHFYFQNLFVGLNENSYWWLSFIENLKRGEMDSLIPLRTIH